MGSVSLALAHDLGEKKGEEKGREGEKLEQVQQVFMCKLFPVNFFGRDTNVHT